MKTPLESVSVSGTAQEGQTLTAAVAPSGATVSYQWKQSASSGYEAIPGATSSTFLITSAQVGKTIVCECTGTGNFSGTVQSSPTSPVTSRPVVVSGVTISGNAQVGQTLTANPTPAQATVTYEWQRSNSASGNYTPIGGATAKTYVLVSEDQGKFIKVKVVGTGTYTGTQTSAATAAVQAQ